MGLVGFSHADRNFFPPYTWIEEAQAPLRSGCICPCGKFPGLLHQLLTSLWGRGIVILMKTEQRGGA